MLMKTLAFAAAGLAAATSAFLLPPEISSDSEVAVADAMAHVNSLFGPIPSTRTIPVNCSGCPILVKNKHGRFKIKQGQSNHLELTFTIDDSQPNQRLLLNGYELYPHADPFHNVLTAPQVLDKMIKNGLESETKKHKAKPGHRRHSGIVDPQLGFSLSIQTQAKDANLAYELLGLDLQIIEVDGFFVDNIPSVHLQLVKNTSLKNIMIAGLTTAPNHHDASPTLGKPGAECTTMLCQWLAYVQQQVARVRPAPLHRPCHGHKGHKGHKDAVADSRPVVPAVSVTAHGEHNLHHHGLAQFAMNIFGHVVLPVFIGIIAGISVSLVGMVLGTIFVAALSFFRPARDNQGQLVTAGCVYHQAAQKEAAIPEKSGLMAHQDSPPSYEEENAAQKQDAADTVDA